MVLLAVLVTDGKPGCQRGSDAQRGHTREAPSAHDRERSGDDGVVKVALLKVISAVAPPCFSLQPRVLDRRPAHDCDELSSCTNGARPDAGQQQ